MRSKPHIEALREAVDDDGVPLSPEDYTPIGEKNRPKRRMDVLCILLLLLRLLLLLLLLLLVLPYCRRRRRRRRLFFFFFVVVVVVVVVVEAFSDA
jgi:hypothetical protein